jgi:hemolysin activation/secretion protein
MIGARWVATGLAVLVWSAPAAVWAQDAPALRERTGPSSAPQALPPLKPPASSMLPDAPIVTAPRVPASGVVTLADVRVSAEPMEARAPAPPGWSGLDDPIAGLKLTLRPGESFDPAWVHRQFADNGLVGRPVPLDRLVAITHLINLALVRAGYINSGLRLAGGVSDGGVLDVRLVYGHTVVAGGAAISFPQGAKGLTPRFVRDRLSASAATPFNALAVEEQFRLLAQDPAIRTINADLRPGQVPGEAVLAMRVEPAARFEAYASAANSRSPSVGAERYALGGSMRNLAIAGDVVNGEVGSTAGHGDFALGYETPFLSSRTSVSVHGGRNDAAVVEEELRPLGIQSTDWWVDGGVARKLIDRPLAPAAGDGPPRPAETFTVGLRVSHREQRTELLGEPFSFSPGSVDGRSRYDAARLTGDYIKRSASQVFALSLTGSVGLDGTRSDIPGAPSPSPNFKVVLVQASYARRLAGGQVELRLRGAAQVADGPLYSGERFSAGGEDSVRGYRENLLLADDGAFGSVELARPFTLGDSGGGANGAHWGAFTASVFLDGAWVDNRADPDPSPRAIGSVGTSLVWTPTDAVSARITYGAALTKAEVAGKRDPQDRGLQFRVTLRPLLLAF